MRISVKERKETNGHSPIQINVITPQEALVLLSGTRRPGKYQTYIPHILQALQKLNKDQYISFHAPVVAGRPEEYVGKHLMSLVNLELKDKNIKHRIRFNREKNILV